MCGFLVELCVAVALSNLVSENNVTELVELNMLAQKKLLPLASVSLGSASSKYP